MFQFFRSKSQKDNSVAESQLPATPDATTDIQTVQLILSGLHCPSCSLNIDGALEDTPGVISASTSYAHCQTDVTFDSKKVTLKTLQAVITELGYKIIT